MELSIAAVGDVGIIGTARLRARRDGYEHLLAPLRSRLTGADLGFANLEMPVGSPDLVRADRSAEFWHEAEVCVALAHCGIGVVSLANSHVMDCGPRGLEMTLEACRDAGIDTVGAGHNLEAARRPARRTIRGRELLILAYAQNVGDAARPDRAGVAPLDPEIMREDLRRWRGCADHLVVSVHWGSMYVDYPPPRVTETARLLAEEGADLVLGHHPHVLQGAQRLGRTLVLYSMGDIVFDAEAGDVVASVAREKRRESGVFTVRIAGVHGLDFDPILLDADGTPGEAEQEQAEMQVERLRQISSELSDASSAFARSAAPTLLRYELQSVGQLLRQGRFDRVLRVLFSVRPRHLAILWQGVRGRRPSR